MGTLKVLVNCNDDGFPTDGSPNELMAYFLSRHREEILDYYAKYFSPDLQTREGPIEEWFGFGSLMCFELGGFSLHFEEGDVVLELSTGE